MDKKTAQPDLQTNQESQPDSSLEQNPVEEKEPWFKNKKVITIVSIIVGILIVGLGIYLVIMNINKSKVEVPDQNVIQLSNECQELKQEIYDLIDNQKFCQEDRDCKFISLPCPLGCRVAINEQVNLTQIYKSTDEYKLNCESCSYDNCNMDNFIECVDGQCIIRESQSIEDIKEWQTYRNQEYGFEFEYPKGWDFDLSDSKNKITVFKIGESVYPSLEIEFLDEKYSEVLIREEASLKKWMEETIEPPGGSMGDIIFSGVSGKEILKFSPVGFTSQSIILPNNNQTIIIRTYKGSALDPILSTFKFLEDSFNIFTKDFKSYIRDNESLNFLEETLELEEDVITSLSYDHKFIRGFRVKYNTHNTEVHFDDFLESKGFKVIFAADGVGGGSVEYRSNYPYQNMENQILCIKDYSYYCTFSDDPDRPVKCDASKVTYIFACGKVKDIFF